MANQAQRDNRVQEPVSEEDLEFVRASLADLASFADIASSTSLHSAGFAVATEAILEEKGVAV